NDLLAGFANHGRANPYRLAVDRDANAVDPGTHAVAAFRVGDAIEKHEVVRAADLVEIAQPGEEIGLMDGTDAHAGPSQHRVEMALHAAEQPQANVAQSGAKRGHVDQAVQVRQAVIDQRLPVAL